MMQHSLTGLGALQGGSALGCDTSLGRRFGMDLGSGRGHGQSGRPSLARP